MKTLTTLTLGTNRIGDVGTQHIADALQYNKVRSALYLSAPFAFVSFNTDIDHIEFRAQ